MCREGTCAASKTYTLGKKGPGAWSVGLLRLLAEASPCPTLLLLPVALLHPGLCWRQHWKALSGDNQKQAQTPSQREFPGPRQGRARRMGSRGAAPAQACSWQRPPRCHRIWTDSVIVLEITESVSLGVSPGSVQMCLDLEAGPGLRQRGSSGSPLWWSLGACPRSPSGIFLFGMATSS